jgi:hypothetical protein
VQMDSMAAANTAIRMVGDTVGPPFSWQKQKIIATNVPACCSKKIIEISGVTVCLGHWLACKGQIPSQLTVQLARFFPH